MTKLMRIACSGLRIPLDMKFMVCSEEAKNVEVRELGKSLGQSHKDSRLVEALLVNTRYVCPQIKEQDFEDF